MSPEVQPRRILVPKNDVKLIYERMIYDEFGPGGFLAWGRLGEPEAARKALLLCFVIVRYINGQSGYTYVGLNTIAENLGYTGGSHGLDKSLKALLNAGVLTQNGKTRRARNLYMSLPEELRDKYPELAKETTGPVIDVTDKAQWKPQQAQTEEIEPPDDYWDTPADPFRDPFASLAKE